MIVFAFVAKMSVNHWRLEARNRDIGPFAATAVVISSLFPCQPNDANDPE